MIDNKTLFIKTINMLNKIEPIDQEEWNSLYPICHFRHFSAGEYLIRTGDRDNSIVFVVNGGFRHFFIDQKGNEKTTDFCIQGEFSGNVDALSSEPGPSECHQCAFEDTDVIILNAGELKDFLSNHPPFEKLLQKVLYQYYLLKTQREKDLMLSDLTQRYQNFLKIYPHLTQLVPQYQIASFLNMTPETLSRIRKKITS